MSVDDLLTALASSDRDTREAAIAAVGPEMLGPLLDALHDEGSPIDSGDAARALRRLGDPAFDAVLAALHEPASEEVRRRFGWAFLGIEVSDVAATYGRALQDEDASIRCGAVSGFRSGREKAVPHAELLVPLLNDPDESVRRSVVAAFQWIGPGTVPLLQQVRRNGGVLRRQVLTALAATGGWDALEPTDQAAVRRLIQVKLTREHPFPDQRPDTGWFALPTGDQAAVLAAFDLSDAEPVTHRLGMSAIYSWQIGQRHNRCSWLYVTAEFDGWTLVFGTPPELSGVHYEWVSNLVWDIPDPALSRTVSVEMQGMCARLSAQFGRAYWYYSSRGDSMVGWCLAEDGQIIRCYDIEFPEETVGPPHPAEAEFRMPDEAVEYPKGFFNGIADSTEMLARMKQYQREHHIPKACSPVDIAERTSVSPATLGPDTEIRGHGVLALTSCGRDNGIPRGAYPI